MKRQPESFPFQNQGGNNFIQLRSSEPEERKIIEIPLTLDLNGFGEVIGIEIVGLIFRTNRNILNGLREALELGKSALSFSFDKESDVFSLTIAESERSLDQRSVKGKIVVNAKGEMVGLFFPER